MNIILTIKVLFFANIHFKATYLLGRTLKLEVTRMAAPNGHLEQISAYL